MRLLKGLLAIAAFLVAATFVPGLLRDLPAVGSSDAAGRVAGSVLAISLLAAAGLALLRSAFSEAPDPSQSRSGTVAALVVIAFCCMGAAAVYLPNNERNPDLPGEMQSTDALLEGKGTPDRLLFANLRDAQKEAVRRFPAVGVNGSPQNQEYVARFKRYQKERPEYFREMDWPVRLATEVGTGASQ